MLLNEHFFNNNDSQGFHVDFEGDIGIGVMSTGMRRTILWLDQEDLEEMLEAIKKHNMSEENK